MQLVRFGKAAEARDLCRRIVNLEPGNGAAWHFLGVLAFQDCRLKESAELLARAIGLEPNVADYHNSMGILLIEVKDYPRAIRSFRTALVLDPRLAVAHYNLGRALEQDGRLQQAADSVGNALAEKPDYAEAHNQLGNILRKLGRIKEAAEAHRQAISLRPDFAPAYNNLAAALAQCGNLKEALAAYRKAMELQPGLASAHSDYLFMLYHDYGATRVALFEESKRFGQRHGRHRIFVHENDRDPDRPLRVGYVSPDYRQHTIPHIIEPILAHHDRSQVKVVCYSAVHHRDHVTTRLQSLADEWRDIELLSFAAAADLVRRDRVDILVDLTGHMAGNRLPLFALKLAPIQAQLGFPGTTGVAAMDYRFTDAHSDPPGQADPPYTETPIWMPDCAWLYQPDADAPAVGPLPALTNEHITFGCLNRPTKLSDGTIDLWCQILRQIPSAKMVLLAGYNGAAANNLGDRFARHGVGAGQLRYMPQVSPANYLKALNQLDIALDPFPYNGETTTCDGLWMGVPAVTLAGDSFHSRRGVSHLTNVGLTQMIARTPGEYVQTAVALAKDLPRLAEVRRTLREKMSKSPLTDGATYTRHLEAVYRKVWRSWCST
jgi:predicted O-linked N-acetylglucosamine transferase (SPINDLY family)